MAEPVVPLLLAAFVVALLYSSVGHAGASGYIAAMALAGVDPDAIKPTALALNVVVATIASWHFWRAGFFSWSLFWPFAALALPLSFLGGYVSTPAYGLKVILAIVLFFSSATFLIRPPGEEACRAPSRRTAVGTGACIGLLAGITGTGGGIFLTPVLIHLRWAATKTAAAVSALFILGNSMAGLLGTIADGAALPALALLVLPTVIMGGAFGSYLGSRRLPHTMIKRCLSAVLAVAGGKLVLT